MVKLKRLAHIPKSKLLPNFVGLILLDSDIKPPTILVFFVLPQRANILLEQEKFGSSLKL
jgi:hypothetical protein